MDDLAPIVLVEDDPDDADLIRHAFGRAGIANPLTLVADGDAAVAWVAEVQSGVRAPPGLFLVDLKLPRRSGFEVLQAIRSAEATRRIPAVVLTSSSQMPDIRRAYDAGANSYLVKPVGRDGLLTLARALEAYWMRLNHPAA
jgi:CheY-like chemotaxis protein